MQNQTQVQAMFVERKVCYSALFTNLVRWHTSAVSFPSDIILAQLACHMSDIMFRLHSGRTNLPLYKHWVQVSHYNCSLYYKSFTIIIYDCNDSVLYYKTMILDNLA